MNKFLDFRASDICKHVGGLLWYIEQEVKTENNLSHALSNRKNSTNPHKTTEKSSTCTVKLYCYRNTSLPKKLFKKEYKKILLINLCPPRTEL